MLDCEETVKYPSIHKTYLKQIRTSMSMPKIFYDNIKRSLINLNF